MEGHRLQRPHSPFQFISAINRLPPKATEHLPRKKDGSINAYALGIAAQDADQFETDQLIDAMRACLEANLQLVTTQLDHELILTEVVVKLGYRLSAFHLFARDWSDVGNFPTHVRECLYGRDDPDHEKCDLNKRSDYRPEKHQDAADARDGAKDHVHYRGCNIKQQPRATEDD